VFPSRSATEKAGMHTFEDHFIPEIIGPQHRPTPADGEMGSLSLPV